MGRFPEQFLGRNKLIKRSLRLYDEPKWSCLEPLQCGAGGARRQQSEQKSRRLGEGGDKWPSRSHASKRVKILRKESIVPKRRTSVERTDGMARSRKALSTPSGHAIATDWIRTQERLCCWQVDAQSVGRLVAVRRPSGHRMDTISAQGDGIGGPELTGAAVPPVWWPQRKNGRRSQSLRVENDEGCRQDRSPGERGRQLGVHRRK